MDAKDQYKQFEPQQYLDQYFGPEAGYWESHRTDLEELHQIFKAGKINGKRLLDIGTGPSILSIISASRHFEEIYLTDYAEANVTFLTSWWKGNSELLPDGIQLVLDKEAGGETVSERTKSIKNKIKAIERIDITENTGRVVPSTLPKEYDVITSAGCLDAAVNSLTEYEQCVKNIRSLLRTDGYIVLLGEVGESFYDIGGTIYTCVKLYSSVIRRILEENGFQMIHLKETPYKCISALETDSSGRMVMVAKKIT